MLDTHDVAQNGRATQRTLLNCSEYGREQLPERVASRLRKLANRHDEVEAMLSLMVATGVESSRDASVEVMHLRREQSQLMLERHIGDLISVRSGDEHITGRLIGVGTVWATIEFDSLGEVKVRLEHLHDAQLSR